MEQTFSFFDTFVANIQNCPSKHLCYTEKFNLLIDGFKRQNDVAKTHKDVNDLIKEYLINALPRKLLHSIWITNTLCDCINDYMNDSSNKCEFSQFDDFNLLDYIYVKDGFLNDCYLLSDVSNINDINIVLDTHRLTIDVKKHLVKYHCNSFDKHKHISVQCKCVLWRHYANLFRQETYSEWKGYEYTLWSTNRIETLHEYLEARKEFEFENDDEESDQRMKSDYYFQKYLFHCNYIINARFIVREILYPTNGGSRKLVAKLQEIMGEDIRMQECQTAYRVSLFDYPWSRSDTAARCRINISDNMIHPEKLKNGKIKSINIDIVKSMKQMDRFLMSLDYKYVRIALMSYTIVDSVDEHFIDNSLPIYPYSFSDSVNFDDFAIDGIHISLKKILHFKQSHQYSWHKKIFENYNMVNNKDCYNIRNMKNYNSLAVKHFKNRLITSPNLQIINHNNCSYYFWQLIRLCLELKYYCNDTLYTYPNWKIKKNFLKLIEKKYHCKWFKRKSSTNVNEIFTKNFHSICKILDKPFRDFDWIYKSELSVCTYIKNYVGEIKIDDLLHWYPYHGRRLFYHALKIYEYHYNNKDFDDKYNSFCKIFEIFKLIDFEKYFKSKIKDSKDCFSLYFETWPSWSNNINIDRVVILAQCFEYFGYNCDLSNNYYFGRKIYCIDKFEKYIKNFDQQVQLLKRYNSVLKIRCLMEIMKILETEIDERMKRRKLTQIGNYNIEESRGRWRYWWDWNWDNIIDDDIYGNVDQFVDHIKQYQLKKGQRKQKETLIFFNSKHSRKKHVTNIYMARKIDRKSDRKSNILQKNKFKTRYMLSLQF